MWHSLILGGLGWLVIGIVGKKLSAEGSMALRINDEMDEIMKIFGAICFTLVGIFLLVIAFTLDFLDAIDIIDLRGVFDPDTELDCGGRGAGEKQGFLRLARMSH